MKVYDFEVPAHATTRHWAVYVVIAKPVDSSRCTFFYVGKVGDNRDGCNPIISRIGNHFSHNKIHSQMRNKLSQTTDYNYKIFYATFGEYDSECQQIDKDRINEIERHLNRLIQEVLKNKDHAKMLNPLGGKYVNSKQREERANLLTAEEKEKIKLLSDRAIM